MAFLALGTGFVNAANERQKENRDERRETRKLAMEVWMKDTLPRVRASRAKDDAAVGRMNTLMADSFYKGQPGLAFYATKWMDQNGKDEAAFREHVATNQIPEELKAQQQKELQNHFNFDTNTNSFSWKDLGANGSGGQAPGAAQPAMAGAEGRKPSFYDKIMGKGNEAQDINRGIGTVAKAAGVDPNAPTTSRFDSINLPGSFESKDPEKERLKAQGREMMARNPDLVRNYGEFATAMASGDSKKVETLMTNPKFTVSRDEAKADKFNQAFRMGAMEGYLRGDYGKDNDMLKAIIQGNSQKIIEGVTKGMKTDEQKLAQAEKLKKIELTYGSLDSPEAFLMMRKSGLLAGIDIPEANLALMEAQARQSILEKQDLNTRLVLATQNAGKPEDQQVTMDDLDAVGRKAPAEGAAAPDFKDAEDMINSPEGLSFDLTPRKPKAPEDAIETLDDVVDRAPPELIRSVKDPVGLLRATSVPRFGPEGTGTKHKQRIGEVIKNITITPDVASRISDDEEYGNQFQDLLIQNASAFPKFSSIMEAQESVHPYGLAMVNGRIVVVPPKKKD